MFFLDSDLDLRVAKVEASKLLGRSGVSSGSGLLMGRTGGTTGRGGLAIRSLTIST